MRLVDAVLVPAASDAWEYRTPVLVYWCHLIHVEVAVPDDAFAVIRHE